MTRVLIFGFAPLPSEPYRVAGPSLRTWHFISALRAAGHDLCLIGDRMAGLYPEDLPPLITTQQERFTYHSVHDILWHDPKALRPLINAFAPECAIAVTTPAASIAAANIGELPLWCDLYGSIMAEAQLKALLYADDQYLAHFWNMERLALERADKFSAVSERQQWSIIGELGLWGRLNQWTSGYHFATTIPIASEDTPFTATERFMRGVRVPEDAFLILYSGGYNTWTDVDTLFSALEQVMQAHPKAHFVSTGGAIYGHDDFTYRRFERLIAESAQRERYHLCGWIGAQDLINLYLESDVAVNTDRFAYETLLGSRTRILDWLRAGLPCVSSDLTELAQSVAAYGAGFTYPPEDAAALAKCLLACAEPERAAQMRHNARRLLTERYTYQVTSAALLAWVAAPQRAPDVGRQTLKLARPYRTLWVELGEMLRTRRLNLSLAVRLWSPVAAVLKAVGLGSLLKGLAARGQRALRFDVSPYQAVWQVQTAPKTVRAAQPFALRAEVQNVGTALWLPIRESAFGVNIAYRWQAAGQFGTWERLPLPKAVPSGKSAQLHLALRAPEQAGDYELVLDLVREGVTWFAQTASGIETGGGALRLPMRVVAED
ncbi:MAG: glycosyltransferase [Chloroflexi bacterium CFX4]|nr:glycosyltransferase [Chloroflexi bacterium CFX4]MDL1921632.1 glycosyltransferase [Chloroflexi bacterium CFX3]